MAKPTAVDQDEGLMAVDNIVTQFNTYEDFLDSQITTVDLYYLEVRAAARQRGRLLASLGPLASGRVVGSTPPGGGPRKRQARRPRGSRAEHLLSAGPACPALPCPD